MSTGKSKPVSQEQAQLNNKADANNLNKGTPGTNITYDRNTSNTAKQIAENEAKEAP
jgi:hypothetical protein